MMFFFLILNLKILSENISHAHVIILDIISEDSFGYICCASNLKSDEKIAIKFYKKQENSDMIEQEIKIGFDKCLICPYIMTFQNDFIFSNEESGGEFRYISMELMNCSLESLLKLLNKKNKHSFFPLRMLFVIEVSSFFFFLSSFPVFLYFLSIFSLHVKNKN
jgi:serine/threonine protein kinase